MNTNFIELFLFALIAFFIINKLISILGDVEEKNTHIRPKKSKSYFGEDLLLENTEILKKTNTEHKDENLSYISTENKEKIISNIKKITNKIENFNIKQFITNAIKAYLLILTGLKHKNYKTLEALVDKEYLKKLRKDGYIPQEVKNIQQKDMSGTITDIFIFGKLCYITINIKGSNKETSSTFIKNLDDNTSNAWYLNKIID